MSETTTTQPQTPATDVNRAAELSVVAGREQKPAAKTTRKSPSRATRAAAKKHEQARREGRAPPHRGSVDGSRREEARARQAGRPHRSREEPDRAQRSDQGRC